MHCILGNKEYFILLCEMGCARRQVDVQNNVAFREEKLYALLLLLTQQIPTACKSQLLHVDLLTVLCKVIPFFMGKDILFP